MNSRPAAGLTGVREGRAVQGLRVDAGGCAGLTLAQRSAPARVERRILEKYGESRKESAASPLGRPAARSGGSVGRVVRLVGHYCFDALLDAVGYFPNPLQQLAKKDGPPVVLFRVPHPASRLLDRHGIVIHDRIRLSEIGREKDRKTSAAALGKRAVTDATGHLPRHAACCHIPRMQRPSPHKALIQEIDKWVGAETGRSVGQPLWKPTAEGCARLTAPTKSHVHKL